MKWTTYPTESTAVHSKIQELLKKTERLERIVSQMRVENIRAHSVKREQTEVVNTSLYDVCNRLMYSTASQYNVNR